MKNDNRTTNNFFLIIVSFCFFEVVFPRTEYDCDFYRVTGDNQASLELAIQCRVWLCPGQTLDASLCNTGVGDNYLRLLDATQRQVAANDDYCQQYGASRIIYTFPYDETSSCGAFQLLQGCYGVPLCYGTTSIIITGSEFGHPTGEPSLQPSGRPSSSPSIPSSVPSSIPSQFPSSSPSSIPTIHPPSSQPTNEPSSKPSRLPTSIPSLWPSGEPSSQPSGEPTSAPVFFPTREPTNFPSSFPTSPSSAPSGAPSDCPSSQPSSNPSRYPTNQPTSMPTAYGSTFECPFYKVEGDSRALSDKTVTCNIWACPGQSIDVNLCRYSSGDTYIRLFEGQKELIKNDDGGCGKYRGSRLKYNIIDSGSNPCRYFSLVQGCYDPSPCQGAAFITILGSGHPTSHPSAEPSARPSSSPTSPSALPSSIPTCYPSNSPTAYPSSFPTGAPSSVPSLPTTATPSNDPTDFWPTYAPSPGPTVDRMTTLVIAILLPTASLSVVLSALLVLRYFKLRYRNLIDVRKVGCVSPYFQGAEEELNKIDLMGDL